MCAPPEGGERWLLWLQAKDVVGKRLSKAAGLCQGDAAEVMRCVEVAVLLFFPFHKYPTFFHDYILPVQCPDVHELSTNIIILLIPNSQISALSSA